ncbi:hypothetical protein [Guptibacillus hwajinpoensis]|uniref:hypothetical protein n=1 Tax=Guptibacillus hwajinpoensis TaxID=208199 RepID=UPI001CFD43E0|nr:hypothetical protein [Pseudalkalibacillus hwajinpoensis]WLR58854.1 hypothetical protein LC071_17055 [Pseudalkalibacillus hwajinpoensis]
MKNETVTDWLIKNKVSHENINFIETVLTYTSSLKVVKEKEDVINENLQSSFPSKKAIIKPDLTYQQFTQILKDNNIEVNAVELLNNYRSQGVCVELCDELLTQV